MKYRGLPTPDDMKGLPVWPLCVCAQAADAALGLIPEHALTMRVRITDGGWTISLEFQLTEITDEDIEDMKEILSQFQMNIGESPRNKLKTNLHYEVVDNIHGDDWTHVYAVYLRNHRTLPGPDDWL